MNEENRSTALIQAESEFGQSITQTGSTAAEMLIEQQRAMIESRLTIAMKRPRNWDMIRTEALKEIETPGFADADMRRQPGSAWYKLPFGDNIEGFSIRAAEMFLRLMGNLDVQAAIMWEDEDRRIVQVIVFDLERNVFLPTQVVVEKTVEKKELKKNRAGKVIEVALKTRVTSTGEVNYIVKADEMTLLRKTNAAISKAARNGILRLVPGGLQAECRNKILEIRHGRAATDPEGERRKIIDGFAKLNVKPRDLELYLGHDVGMATPAQLDHLRELWEAIQKGNVTWHAALTQEMESRGETSEEPKEKGLDAITKDLKDKAKAKKTAKSEPQVDVDVKPKESKAVADLRSAALTAGEVLFGDDYLNVLSKMCRNRKPEAFSFTAMNEENARWLVEELNRIADEG